MWSYAFPQKTEAIVAENRIWSAEDQNCVKDELSYAAVRGRDEPQKEFSEVVLANNRIFIGVYDGHGRNEAAVYVDRHLLPNIIGIINDRVPEEGELRSAFAKTETEFIACAREKVASSPSIDGAGASCLVAFVRDQKVIISHVGNCRAVVGVKKWGILKYIISSEPLTTENFEKWGILDEPICDPILCSVPSFSVRDIVPRDSFIVVASDVLLNILSNDEVVQFVYDNRGKNGIAKLLVEKAMRKAEEMREKRIKDMVGSVEVGRAYDDITVVVLLLNKGKKKASLKKSDSPHLPLQLPLITWYSTLFQNTKKSTIPYYQRQLEGQMWRI